MVYWVFQIVYMVGVLSLLGLGPPWASPSDEVPPFISGCQDYLIGISYTAVKRGNTAEVRHKQKARATGNRAVGTKGAARIEGDVSVCPSGNFWRTSLHGGRHSLSPLSSIWQNSCFALGIKNSYNHSLSPLSYAS